MSLVSTDDCQANEKLKNDGDFRAQFQMFIGGSFSGGDEMAVYLGTAMCYVRVSEKSHCYAS